LPGFVRLARPDARIIVKSQHGGVENLSGWDLTNFVRKFDCCANL
jgi:hypothetical protein